ncbi:phage major capsid protein, partial [bacterium]
AQLQYGVLNWKYYYFSVNFTMADFTQSANAKEAVIDLIESKKELAKADFYRSLSTDVYGTSTSNALAFEGLADIVAASGTAYAGLTDTDYTDATAPYLPYISTATTLSYAVISDMITQSRARRQQMGGTGKMFGLMNPYLFNQMLGILQNQQMFINGNKMVDAGFESFNINGVEFFMDADAPGTADGTTGDNYIYLIPEDVLQLQYKYGIDSASPFDGQVRLPNQPIISIQKYMAANVVCNNRRVISVCKTLV